MYASAPCTALNAKTFNISPGQSIVIPKSGAFDAGEIISALWQWVPSSKTATATIDVSGNASGAGAYKYFKTTDPGVTDLVAAPILKAQAIATQLYNNDQTSKMSGSWSCAGRRLVPSYPSPKMLGNDASGSISSQGSSVALSADGNTALMGGPNDNSLIGAAWAFTRSNGAWTQQGAKLVATNAIGQAEQGNSVALSADGNTALMGGPLDNSNAGAAWVFVRNGGSWQQQAKLLGSGVLGAFAAQGYAVALAADGNTAIVGGPCDNSPGQCTFPYGGFGVGAVWIFTRNGAAWIQQAKLTPTGNIGAASFGASVALSADGNTALIGGGNDNSNAGAAWVFIRSNGIWTQNGAKLVGTSPNSTSFGTSVALSADASTAAISGNQASNPNLGGDWFFSPVSGVWTQQAFIGGFGPSPVGLSADGSTAIIGQSFSNSGIGSAAVYRRPLGSWVQTGTLLGDGAIGSSEQGTSVALSADGSTALVGGANDNTARGAAWPYQARSNAAHDFNNDGYSDIAWRDTSGNLVVWLMNGGTIASGGGLGAVPVSWSIVGQRDFNGDGKAAWLWRDTSGNTVMWFMNGTAVSSGLGLGNIPTSWSVVGTGDFNGDGHGDILWRDTSGNTAIWLMNGGTIQSGGALGSIPITWSVAGVADFDGDGKADILWRDNSGNTVIWFMNGTTVTSGAGLGNIATTWAIAGTGDFNGDGTADILWRDASGNLVVWLMDGGTVQSGGGLGNIPTTWSVAETGDFDGDGKSDILWRDNSGNTAIWFMNGLTVSSGAGLGNIPTTWTIQGANAD